MAHRQCPACRAVTLAHVPSHFCECPLKQVLQNCGNSLSRLDKHTSATCHLPLPRWTEACPCHLSPTSWGARSPDSVPTQTRTRRDRPPVLAGACDHVSMVAGRPAGLRDSAVCKVQRRAPDIFRFKLQLRRVFAASGREEQEKETRLGVTGRSGRDLNMLAVYRRPRWTPRSPLPGCWHYCPATRLPAEGA